MNRILPLGILLGFMYLLGNLPLAARMPPGAATTLALGFIVLAAYIAGEILNTLKFPKITGYMLTGVFFGPQVLGIISNEAVGDLKLIDSIALSLIAFSAGREMKLELLRRFRRSIFSITTWVTMFEACGVGLTVWFLSGWWAPLQVPAGLRLPLALVFGLLAIAKSPITTIAIIEETDVRNRFSQTILGVVVLKDVLLVVVFSLISGLLQQLSAPGSLNGLEIVLLLGWELIGSLFCGMLLGVLITLYLRWVRLELGIFIVLVAFLATETAHQLGLDPLLLCMMAGMFIENVSPEGDSFLESLKLGSPLIYAVFFAIAGAHLDLLALKQLWLVVMLLLGVRAGLSQLGVFIGSRLVEDEPLIRRFGWLGLINQAGVTLALALLVAERMPEIGRIATPVALGMIAASDFFAPPLFKWALLKSCQSNKSIDVVA
jgi:Kef-type K+ transport system membrane component KefB